MRPEPWAHFLAVGVEEHLKMPMSALAEATHEELCDALSNFNQDLPKPVMFINCWYTGMAYADYTDGTQHLRHQSGALKTPDKGHR